MTTIAIVFDDGLTLKSGKTRVGLIKYIQEKFVDNSEVFYILTNDLTFALPFSNISISYDDSKKDIIAQSNYVIFVWRGANNDIYKLAIDALNKNKDPHILNPHFGDISKFVTHQIGVL